MASWAELFGGGNPGGGSGQMGSSGDSFFREYDGGTGGNNRFGMGASGDQAAGFYKEPNMMQRIFDSLSKNRQNIMDTRDRYAGAGSLSGVIGGGGGARGSVVNNTPGIVQLLSLLANRNRQF